MKQKNINYLIIMRIWAAVILAACCYWIFSEQEIEFQSLFFVPKIFLPWIYFYGTDFYALKKTTTLIVPLFMNIVLWFPCYRGYIFIRVILYVERIAAIFWILFWFPGMALSITRAFENTSRLLIILLFVCCATLNELVIANFKKEKYKEKFSAAFRTEQELIILIVRMIVIFYLTILSLLMLETIIQKKFFLNYARTEIVNFIIVQEENKPVQKIHYERIEAPTFSRNNKMLAGIIKSHKEDTKKLFIIDSASMQTIKIFEVNNTIDKKNTNNAYAFTPDSKGLVVSNGDQKIKFTILDIVSGKVDTRFSDPKNLLEKSPALVERVLSITFNPSGKYFIVSIKVNHQDYRLEIWDYEKGTLVHVEKIKGDFRRSTWLSEENLGILYEHDKNTQYKELLLDDNVALSVANAKSTTRMLSRYLVSNDFTIKYLARVNKYDVQIWNLEEKKETVFLKRSIAYHIKNIKLHPDGKQIIVFEALRNKMGRVTYWNIYTGQKQGTFFIKSPPDWYELQLIDNGNKALLIGSNKVVIVSSEDALKKPQYDVRNFLLITLAIFILQGLIYHRGNEEITSKL